MFAFFDSATRSSSILVVVLVLFGGAQLPKLAKNLGKAQKEFKEGLAEGQKASRSKGCRRSQPTPPSSRRLPQIDRSTTRRDAAPVALRPRRLCRVVSGRLFSMVSCG